jgi:hypothetical protein
MAAAIATYGNCILYSCLQKQIASRLTIMLKTQNR